MKRGRVCVVQGSFWFHYHHDSYSVGIIEASGQSLAGDGSDRGLVVACVREKEAG